MGKFSFIKNKINSNSLIVSYLAPGELTERKLYHLNDQLICSDVVNYSFATLEDCNVYLNRQATENIRKLNEWRYSHLRENGEPAFALILSIGGWGDRLKFTKLLTDKYYENIFVNSIRILLQNHDIDGIDLDWENEITAAQLEIDNAGKVLKSIKQEIGNNYYITAAAPATSFYWNNYPHAELWKDQVDWLIVMGYDLYGTFGPYTECASNLFPVEIAAEIYENYNYPYPRTISVDEAMKHYHSQGVPKEKLVLGVPFYAHMYYIEQLGKFNGLRQQVFDANISCQYTPDKEFFEYMSENKTELNDGTSWCIKKILTENKRELFEFYSSETTESIKFKAEYVKQEKYAGMSMWELSQDISHESEYSLLKAMYNRLNAK